MWSAYRGWLWNLSGRCPFAVWFCWLSKLKCRRGIFTSTHPSLCIVFERTSVHLRVDPIRSCIRPARATQLQKACQSRDLNIDSSENAIAHADGWDYKRNNWTGMNMPAQNNSFSRYKLRVLVQWGQGRGRGRGKKKKKKKRAHNIGLCAFEFQRILFVFQECSGWDELFLASCICISSLLLLPRCYLHVFSVWLLQ